MEASTSRLIDPHAETSFLRALNAPFSPTPFPSSECHRAPRISDPQVPVDHQPLSKPLFTASGNWEWLNGQPLHGIQELESLHDTELHKTTLRTCKAGDRSFACINKSWRLETRHPGIMSELWLYKNPLKSLQGRVIPKLIAVRVGPSRFNLVFDLPHQTFFIEPSADMPEVLKRRVVEAVDKLHSKGVGHHTLSLEDILIGGDGQVYIYNFHNARYLEEKPVVHLPMVKDDEFAMEMRRIKFKLDYQDARQKEQDWLRLQVEHSRAAELETTKWKKAKKYRLKKVLPKRTQVPGVPLREVEGWFTELNRQPRRFIVPGQEEEDFEWELKRFHNVLRQMEETDRLGQLHVEPSMFSPNRTCLSSEMTGHAVGGTKTIPLAGAKRKRSQGSFSTDMFNLPRRRADTECTTPESARHYKHEDLRSGFKLVSPLDVHASVQENNLVLAWPMISVRDFAKTARLMSGETTLGKRLRQEHIEHLELVDDRNKRRKLDEEGSWTTWAHSFLNPVCAFVDGIGSYLVTHKPSSFKPPRPTPVRCRRPSLGSPPRRLVDILKHPAMRGISYSSEPMTAQPCLQPVVMTRPPHQQPAHSLASHHFFPSGSNLAVAASLEPISRVWSRLIRPLA
ncbi:hypothetical protein CPB83DRAFT_901508 [Crepidotus variabilis]|uniref:Uncharacterized protein n=1 Tax=Crepidotus variabilis TaxID=179855 RepID=A0A9P6ETD6_9AGAR|nr:hypothetical protein CPB83DRAFT_901508 [Crepidotus variabilis]